MTKRSVPMSSPATVGAVPAARGELATKADLDAMELRMRAALRRALLFQAFAIVGAAVALVKLLP